MSCSDSKRSKKRKSNKTGNMGDVLGKECGDSEKDDVKQVKTEENVREEADGAPSSDEHSLIQNGELEIDDSKRIKNSKVR